MENIKSVTFWNAVALEAHRQDYTFSDSRLSDKSGQHRSTLSPLQAGPTRVSRAFAIIHLSMFDAWQSIQPIAGASLYSTILPPNLPNIPNGGKARELFLHAAVAGAAALTTKYFFGGQHADLQLEGFRSILLSAGQKPSALLSGLAYGSMIGRSLIDNRALDGSANGDPRYRTRSVNGAFAFDPFSRGQQALGAEWGSVATFGGFTADKATLEFQDPLGQAAIGDYLKSAAEYRDQLEEVRDYGAHEDYPALKRSAEQTLIGKFWGYDGVREIGVPPRLYNQCLRAIAEQHKLDEEQSLLLYATANMAMADAGIAAWAEKYTYHVARPVTGIRKDMQGFGNDDGASKLTFDDDLSFPIQQNASYADVEAWLATKPSSPAVTDGEPAWKPLGAPQTNALGSHYKTPGFPAYPSGHSTFGTVCFDVARRLLTKFGLDPDTGFEFVSDEFDGENIDADGSTRPKHTRLLNPAQAMHENAISRVYLGVHWRMDAVEGIRLGLRIIDLYEQSPTGPLGALF